MELYDYQQTFVDEILYKLNTKTRLCAQLATGGGKTVVFANIANNYKGKVLILVDSQELVQQTAKTIKEAATFEAKNKNFPSYARVVVGMTPTIWSRSSKQKDIIAHFDLVIVDEAHEWEHNKLFNLLHPFCKIIGFTATPVRGKRITFNDKNGDEWTREELMSDVYEDIVCGIGIDELIEQNYLVDEQLYTIKVSNIDKLKSNGSDDFTTESLNDVFDNQQYAINIFDEYKDKCQGKKTMIFTPTTSANLRIYEEFLEKGVNCRMYDSVNSNKNERIPTVDWFRHTDGAVLFNVGCFTKGFDVKEVEAIILARALGSLSLFIQIAGRGSRTTNQFYKDRFIFIDGGCNVDRFGMWSMSRDWKHIFFNGWKPPKKKVERLEDVKVCDSCEFMMAKHVIICPNCGELNEPKPPKPKEITESTTEYVKKVYPNAKKIINYTANQNEDKFFALKILNNQILDLFIATKTTPQNFIDSLKMGKFNDKMDVIFKPHFYQIIYSNLPSEANRTYIYQLEILTNKIKKYYGIQI